MHLQLIAVNSFHSIMAYHLPVLLYCDTPCQSFIQAYLSEGTYPAVACRLRPTIPPTQTQAPRVVVGSSTKDLHMRVLNSELIQKLHRKATRHRATASHRRLLVLWRPYWQSPKYWAPFSPNASCAVQNKIHIIRTPCQQYCSSSRELEGRYFHAEKQAQEWQHTATTICAIYLPL